MASIKDVENAMNGDKVPQENVGNEFHNSYNKVESDFVIFKLKASQKRGVYIDGTDDVINPKTGRAERIRLLAGVSSIWLSEQKDVDKEFVRKNRRSLEFRGRICRINKMDTAALEFARLCNSNTDVKNRLKATRFEFFEFDPVKQAEESLKKEMLELEMAIKAKEMDGETLKKYASFIGIHLINELAQVKPENGLRQEVMLYAKKNPIVFQNMINSASEIEVHWQIKSAIIENLIDIAKQPGSAYWGSGGFICKMPSTQNPVKYLTEFAMTNTNEGRDFLSKLKTISK